LLVCTLQTGQATNLVWKQIKKIDKMASSCGAFHQEALRKQRVIDRKRAAAERLRILEAEEAEAAAEKHRLEEEARQKRVQDKMDELQRHLNEVKDDGKKTKKRR